MASPAYERRNELARARGYRNYYDYRIHDNGRIPAGEPPLQGGARARARGHTGRSDFLRLIRANPDAYVLPVGLRRWPNGQWALIHILVLLPDGTERHFYLRSRPGAENDPASQRSLEFLKAELQASGNYVVAAPSIDVFADMDEPPDFDELDEVA